MTRLILSRTMPVVALGLVGMGMGLQGCNDVAAAPLAPLPPAIHVTTAVVQARNMPRSLPLSGSLMANQQADVAANASGRIVKTFVERGTFVAAEAPLLQLDMRTAALSEQEARANLENAQAQEQLATAQCKRNQELLDKGAISKDEWDRISNGCLTAARAAEAARARAELASKTLADATVRAPFSGMIAERYVSRGEYVQPSTRVAMLVELDPLRLQITVAEADLKYIRDGQKVSFHVQAYPGETFTGTVRYIGPAVRANTRDLVVEALVSNKEHTLRPGMFATVSMELNDEALPVIPRAAMRIDGASPHVFVVVKDRLEERAVQLGPERDGEVAILEGVQAGDTIVTQLTPDVKDGVPVN